MPGVVTTNRDNSFKSTHIFGSSRPIDGTYIDLITNMPKDPLLKGLGDVLGEISLDSIQPRDDLATTKVDLATLTSYNLLPKYRRTIIVPGG
ncbi:uncharacterized protein ASPGLDRAFT_298463 [Aspergillus glaucus CBS 516.65]|uniref:Uncharacterized protein n=1 Tax=Aspergillus glaucus CBS 516.65 TaxID=1160497 RepID=A0A1L9VJW3_ASPGL|nr:hypothetical protein ASPGLDRAFT_298463 [Aspergillus glaucus CBS 516.65]OJJ84175.1 hypothetical protein ASPGLDRAFT_298463 [Aspergillus glaucus CBS 516.65]